MKNVLCLSERFVSFLCFVDDFFFVFQFINRNFIKWLCLLVYAMTFKDLMKKIKN